MGHSGVHQVYRGYQHCRLLHESGHIFRGVCCTPGREFPLRALQRGTRTTGGYSGGVEAADTRSRDGTRSASSARQTSPALLLYSCFISHVDESVGVEVSYCYYWGSCFCVDISQVIVMLYLVAISLFINYWMFVLTLGLLCIKIVQLMDVNLTKILKDSLRSHATRVLELTIGMFQVFPNQGLRQG